MGMPSFSKLMKKRYDFHPAIPLAYPMRLGSIGVLSRGVFDYKGSLQALSGIDIGEERPPMPTANPTWTLDSGKDVSLKTKLAGNMTRPVSWLPKAEAGVIVTFGSKDSFVFSASEFEFVGLDQEALIERSVLDFYLANRQRWDRSWIVVTELALASSALAILSRQADTTVELSASGDITAPVNLADLSAGFEVAFSSSSVDQQIARRGPVGWRGFRIHDGWLTKPRPKRAIAPESATFGDVYESI